MVTSGWRIFTLKEWPSSQVCVRKTPCSLLRLHLNFFEKAYSWSDLGYAQLLLSWLLATFPPSAMPWLVLGFHDAWFLFLLWPWARRKNVSYAGYQIHLLTGGENKSPRKGWLSGIIQRLLKTPAGDQVIATRCNRLWHCWCADVHLEMCTHVETLTCTKLEII